MPAKELQNNVYIKHSVSLEQVLDMFFLSLFRHAYVRVQFYPWSNLYFLCFKLIIQNKIKFRPRMKFNHNVLYCSSKLKKKIGVIIHKLELADKGNEKST